MRPWFGFCLWIARTFMRIFMRPEISGRENVPQTGGLIVAVNHMSYWDPPLSAVALNRETHFLAKAELFGIPVFGALIRSLNAIPVRRGGMDLQGINSCIRALKAESSLIVFPEGGRSMEGELKRARPGIGLLWTNARVPVLPAYLVGTNRIRRWIVRREKVRIRFGPLIPVEELADLAGEGRERERYQRIGDRVMTAIAQLKHEMEAEAKSASGPTKRGAIS
jgi:1-acyl-sn-glycerol-3-phosphate acyltransferase